MDNQLGSWMTPGGGMFGNLNAPNNSGGSGGGTLSGFKQMLDPFTGQPFSGTMEEYLSRVRQMQNMNDPTNHRQSSGPSMSRDMLRQMMVNQIRGNGNDPSAYLGRLDAVSSGQIYNPPAQPQQPAGYGFNGVSNQGMGPLPAPKSSPMQNQLLQLLKQGGGYGS